jgi:hypothetical protein
MRRIIICAVALGGFGLLTVPALAGNAVKSEVKILFATDEAHGQVGVYGKLKTSLPCKQPERKFTLLEDGDKVDSSKGLSDAFFITDEVGLGDTVQIKATSATIAAGSERVKCKGSTSDEFVIDELEDG